MAGWMAGWMGGWLLMGGWIDGETERRTDICPVLRITALSAFDTDQGKLRSQGRKLRRATSAGQWALGTAAELSWIEIY